MAELCVVPRMRASMNRNYLRVGSTYLYAQPSSTLPPRRVTLVSADSWAELPRQHFEHPFHVVESSDAGPVTVPSWFVRADEGKVLVCIEKSSWFVLASPSNLHPAPHHAVATSNQQALACPSPHKVAYAHQEDAIGAALHFTERFGCAPRPYRCACGVWHLSTKPDRVLAHA